MQDRDDNLRGQQDEPALPQPAPSQPPPSPQDVDDVHPRDLPEATQATSPADAPPADPALASPFDASPFDAPLTLDPAVPDVASDFADISETQGEPAAEASASSSDQAYDFGPSYPPRRALPAHLTRVEPQQGPPPPVQRVPPPPPPPRPAYGQPYAPAMVMTHPWIILKPRIWPSIIAVVMAFAFAMLTSAAVLLLAFLINRPGGLTSGIGGDSLFIWMSDVMPTKWGAALFTLPVQIPLLLGAIVAAACSPEGFRQRLGLVASRYPWWTYPVFMLGTPIIALAVSILGLVIQHATVRNGGAIEPNEMELLIVGPAGLSGALTVLLLIAVMPAICEELLFRGLLQRRLARRWPIVGAIALATGLFLLAHLNPIQIIVLIPLGIWLGVLAWQSGSILPSILCHFANNAVAIVAARIFSDLPVGSATQTMAVVGYAMIPLLLMFIAAIASVAVVIAFAVRHGPPLEQPLPLGAMRRVSTFNPPPDAIVYAPPQYAPAPFGYAPPMPAPHPAGVPAAPAPPPSAAPQRLPPPPADEHSLWG